MQNFMKTIINAIKNWTNAKISDIDNKIDRVDGNVTDLNNRISNSVADWNEMNSDSDSFIKNKPDVALRDELSSVQSLALNAEITANTKMNATNPVGTGSFSMNRKASTVIGDNSHAEGSDTTASGNYSHAEGFFAIASNSGSHAEGKSSVASGHWSHAEGYESVASGRHSHAEGYGAEASGDNSHAEGSDTTASGEYSHAEGGSTTASGEYSHAEGSRATASGSYSHAEGYYTTTSHKSQHVQGEYNVLDPSTNTGNKRGTYAHIVGNGTFTTRSNAHTLDWNGNAWYAGDVYIGSTSGTNRDEGSKKLATEEYTNKAIEENNNSWDLDVFQGEMLVGSFDAIYEKLNKAEPIKCRIRNIYQDYNYNNVITRVNYDGDNDYIVFWTITEEGREKYKLTRENSFEFLHFDRWAFESN